MFEPEVFQKQMYRIEESICDFVGIVQAPLSDSAPGELCPPRYAREISGSSLSNHADPYFLAWWSLTSQEKTFSKLKRIKNKLIIGLQCSSSGPH